MTKKRPAVGNHVRIEQLGGSHVVEPGEGHAVRRDLCFKIKAFTIGAF